ncbi:hypothetical protein MKI84_01405 [Ancylobacter sp. A5.8]|uniref:hypothetical protein n=1 Tax=Ancylobacter gelatini TaxID=2919920 RepID=UPI001F4DECAE|nr:hypothetical protein [Ancylobacter gelatini]MCJ8141566.1 hypothetical protein [Ancylobacter gelatini]
MRKLILASATLSILAIGAVANAHADGREKSERQAFVRTQQESAANVRGEVWLGPGNTVPAYSVGTMYEVERVYTPAPAYEGRTYYVQPEPMVEVPFPVESQMYRNHRPIDDYNSAWYQPGDAAIIKQQIKDQRGQGK